MMKRTIIKIITYILVCVTIITTLVISINADNQTSKNSGQITSTTGIVWCSYNISESIDDNHKRIIYAENLNVTPTYIPTVFADSVYGIDQEEFYYISDYNEEFISSSYSFYRWDDWEKVSYISPLDDVTKNAYVGIYQYNHYPPNILLESATNNLITYRIGFEDIITWDENFLDIGDKQSTITTIIKINKAYVNNIESIVTSGYLHSEKIGGTEEDIIDNYEWLPNIIEHEDEYWITIDNITRPSETDYKALYKNDGYFYLKMNTNNEPNPIYYESEVIVIEDLDNIIRKEIVDNIPEANLIPVADFGSWIASSISGFMNFTIIEGVSIGGIFIMLISFACVMWLLKLFAGG